MIDLRQEVGHIRQEVRQGVPQVRQEVDGLRADLTERMEAVEGRAEARILGALVVERRATSEERLVLSG